MPLDRYRNTAPVEGIDLHSLALADEADGGSESAKCADDTGPEDKVWLQLRVVSGAVGSAYMEQGATKVLCSVHGPMEPKRSLMLDTTAEQSRAQLHVYYKLAPFARPGRVAYQPDEAEKRAAAFMQDSLAPSLRLDRLPKSRIELHCLVLQDAGSCLATAITCAGAALADARLELYDLVTAATVFRPVGGNSDCWSLERRPGSSLAMSSVTLAYLRNLRQLAGLAVEPSEPLDPADVDAACRACVEPCKRLHATVRRLLLDTADAGLHQHQQQQSSG